MTQSAIEWDQYGVEVKGLAVEPQGRPIWDKADLTNTLAVGVEIEGRRILDIFETWVQYRQYNGPTSIARSNIRPM
jgi:hypothetical protein